MWLLKKNDFWRFRVPLLHDVKVETNDKASRCVKRRRELPSKNLNILAAVKDYGHIRFHVKIPYHLKRTYI